MLDSVWDDDELTRLDHEILVAQLHAQPALHDQEQLILAVVVVPDELALELRERHQVVVHRADDLGTPLILNPPEHLDEIDLADGRAGATHEARSSTDLVSTTVENSPLKSASTTASTS